MADAPQIDAVVLCAGEGTRLRPLTLDRPKPMVEVAGLPALDYVLGWLSLHGFRSLGINLHHRPDAIVARYGDGSAWGLSIAYSKEERLRGTAGGVRSFLARLANPCVVAYGDVLSSIDLGRLVAAHLDAGAAATLALYRVDDPWTRGVVDVDPAGWVTAFREKPPPETCVGARVNAGIYVLDPAVLLGFSDAEPLDFGFDVFPSLLAQGRRILARELPGFVHDYGSPALLAEADAAVRAGVPGMPPLHRATGVR